MDESVKLTPDGREGQETEHVITEVPLEKDVGWAFWKKRRNIVGLLVFTGTLTTYMLRANLSIAIVIMAMDENAEFSWDSHLRGLILASFYYGYFCTQFVGGWLSARIGGKSIFGCGVGLTAIVTLATPYSARSSVSLLIALRIVIGLFQGLVFPSMQSIWANWIPPLERSKFASLTTAGASTGMMFAMLSGSVAKYTGWPAIFYIHGAFGVTWYASWLYYYSDKPEDDPRITQEEIDFINLSINRNYTTERKKVSYPWKTMLSSAPVWAVFIAHSCAMFTNYTSMTQLPSLIKGLWGFKTDSSGYISGFSAVASVFIALASGTFADYLRSNEYLTTTQVRKTIVCTGFAVQAVLMALVGFWSWTFGAVICLVVFNSINGMIIPGYNVNFLDIAPRHASVLQGIGNTFATISGIVSPSLVGYIVQNQAPAEWRIILVIMGVICSVGAILYGILASGEEQPWSADPQWKAVRSTRIKRKKRRIASISYSL